MPAPNPSREIVSPLVTFVLFILLFSFIKDFLKIRCRFIAELFSQRDNNALGAAEVAESIRVLILHHLANEFSPMFLQTSNDVVDVRDSEHDAAYAQRVYRRVLWLSPDRLGRVVLLQLK